MEELYDAYGRSFKTLRLSLTTTCNLACVYCVDPEKKGTKSAAAFPAKIPLSTNGFIEAVAALHNLLQLETLRLTGGEPTLYKELIPLIQGLSALGIPEIKMTSNGYLISRHASAYKTAGLSSINISLDALDPEVFYAINKRHALQKTLDGIDAALDAGLEVKVNCVLMKGVNDHQISAILHYCQERNVPLRFLELMQMGHLHHNYETHFYSEAAVLDVVSQQFTFIELPRKKHATTKYYVLEDGYSFGIISNVSDPFCDDCNRLRLDSYGTVYGCLSESQGLSIADDLKYKKRLIEKLKAALLHKKRQFSGSLLSMQQIGG
jgi:cyclic pyranopterin phosphate synthase